MPQLFFLIDYIVPYIFILAITTSINYFTIYKEMAKISVAKPNRCECRKRGPMFKDTTSQRTQAPRISQHRMLTPYNNIDYKANVLAPDNIRILEEDTICKLDREDRSGQNMLELYYSFKDRIIGQREYVSTHATHSILPLSSSLSSSLRGSLRNIL